MTIISRRQWIGSGVAATAFGTMRFSKSDAADGDAKHGQVVGDPEAARVGGDVLRNGGNAIDAIVAGAFAAAVTALGHTGIGGYGGAATIAIEGGRRVLSLDFNSTAPSAMREDTFQLDKQGNVVGRVNEFGWLSAGVPGILAGLALTLKTGGTWSLRDTLQPAIAITRDGFVVSSSLATAIQGSAAQFSKDPGSRKLYFDGDSPQAAGKTFRNPELADMLTTLAQSNLVDPFYRGEYATQIASQFQKHGGLVLAADLASYEAHVVTPLTLDCNGMTIHTAPLTAGGLSVLQAFRTVQAMRLETISNDVQSIAIVEAMRWAWRDRLQLLGDPNHVEVPIAKLLSEEYAGESALQIMRAIASRRPIEHRVKSNDQGGTIHLSSADKHGNFASLTLTHGGGFGAKVTVEGLGLTLGHGVSRFDVTPGHPNAPGPSKRPLHNMVPSIVTQNGQALLAVGGRGGRKIPNAVFTFLTEFVLQKQSIAESMAAPRMHTEGNLALELEKNWPDQDRKRLTDFGYQVKAAGSATLSAIAKEGGRLVTGMR